MADHGTKKKPVMTMVVAGAITAALYLALYMKEGMISEVFGKGGMYAILPIATAFIFSFAHGSFTGAFWSVLGVEASKKTKGAK